VAVEDEPDTVERPAFVVGFAAMARLASDRPENPP